MKFQIVGRQFSEVSQSWFRRAPTPPRTDANPETPAHAYSHLHKSGEMNHMGRHHCEACDVEMRLASAADVGGGAITGPRYRWQCPACGARDETGFRICRTSPAWWSRALDRDQTQSAADAPVSLRYV